MTKLASSFPPSPPAGGFGRAGEFRVEFANKSSEVGLDFGWGRANIFKIDVDAGERVLREKLGDLSNDLGTIGRISGSSDAGVVEDFDDENGSDVGREAVLNDGINGAEAEAMETELVAAVFGGFELRSGVEFNPKVGNLSEL